MISSLQNNKVKDWMRLYQKKYRRNQYLILDEVIIKEAIKYGYLDTLIYTGKNELKFKDSIEVSLEVMQKLTKGKDLKYLGIGHIIEEKLDHPNKIVMLDDLQDPQNVGMIMHACELFGHDTLILNNNTADIYHEKCLSASLGSIYHLNILRCNLEDKIKELQADGFKVYATGLSKETKELEEVSSTNKMAFILGNEGSGVKESIYDIVDEVIKIRMENIDSLNVAMAGTIVMYHFSK